jgi:hypothetical protein
MFRSLPLISIEDYSPLVNNYFLNQLNHIDILFDTAYGMMQLIKFDVISKPKWIETPCDE